MRVQKFLLILATAFLFACSNGGSGKFSSRPLEDLKKNEGEIKNLSEADKKLLTEYLTYLQKNTKGENLASVTNKTYVQVLDRAREWKTISSSNAIFEKVDQAAEKNKNEQMEAERKSQQDKIARLVTVTFVKRTILAQAPEVNIQGPAILLEYDIQNKGGKSIAAIKGTVVFKDSTGKVLLTYPWEMQKTTPPTDRIQVKEIYELSAGKTDWINFAKAEEGKFFFEFNPDIVILDGGETLKTL